MFAKWWDDRLHDMEVAAEHGDSRSLHQGVKQLLDLIANDGTSKKALSSNHQGDHERMTKHFHDILNITRSINNSVLEGAPDFSHLGKLINWKEPQEDDVRWDIKQLNVNKAADSLGLQAEMFRACVKHENGKACKLVRLMTQTVQRLWKGEEVPTSWLDAILIPFVQ